MNSSFKKETAGHVLQWKKYLKRYIYIYVIKLRINIKIEY